MKKRTPSKKDYFSKTTIICTIVIIAALLTAFILEANKDEPEDRSDTPEELNDTQIGTLEASFDDLISESETVIDGTNNRLNNITVATETINGTILRPGDVFSFNDIVGERTRERGYLEAGAFVGGRLVDEVGGGICQVSSTLYHAVLLADLEVVDRRPHGFTVSYLPFGCDAAVSWGSLDFKFKNSTDYAVKIESTVSDRNLTVKLIGTNSDDTHIEIETVSISSTPFQVVEREDDSVPYGSTEVYDPGMEGQVVETYKRLYSSDGELISRTLVSKDTYKTQDRIILVGRPPASKPQQPTPNTTTPSTPTPNTTAPGEPPSIDKVREKLAGGWRYGERGRGFVFYTDGTAFADLGSEPTDLGPLYGKYTITRQSENMYLIEFEITDDMSAHEQIWVVNKTSSFRYNFTDDTLIDLHPVGSDGEQKMIRHT